MPDSGGTDRAAISSRYRLYCDACQSGQLEKLTQFWSLPALFSMDFGNGSEPLHKLIQTSSELEALYSSEFGSASRVDKTTVDSENITLFGESLAVVETKLSHWAEEDLYDTMHASYGCRKVDGEWWFVSHISNSEKAGERG